MERIVLKQDTTINKGDTVNFEEARKQQEKLQEICSCNLLLKNLLKNNVRLLKLHEIRTMLLF